MTTAVVLGMVALVLLGPAGLLIDAGKWQLRAPRAAIVLWQATGLAGALALMGAGLAVTTASYHLSLAQALVRMADDARRGRPLTGLGVYGALGLELATDIGIVLAVGLVLTSKRLFVARSRHRRLLDLVSTSTDRAPDALVLDDPRSTAYCVPGFRPRLVVSAGAVEALSDDELSAVMNHERAHANGRHDIALFPFLSLACLLEWVPYVRRSRHSVAMLLEMAADDFASRRCGRQVLASALVTMAGSGGVPFGMFAVSTTGVSIRLHRLVGNSPQLGRHCRRRHCGVCRGCVSTVCISCLRWRVLSAFRLTPRLPSPLTKWPKPDATCQIPRFRRGQMSARSIIMTSGSKGDSTNP